MMHFHIFTPAVFGNRIDTRSYMDSVTPATHTAHQANGPRAAWNPEISGTFSVHVGKMDLPMGWHRSKMLKRWIQFLTEQTLLEKHAGTHTQKPAEPLCFTWISSSAGQVLSIKRCYLMDDAGWDRPVILLPKNVIYSYPWTPLTVPKCIFKSFPFTLPCLRLARIFNMPICFPCHLRRFITAKCPWKKSLEYKCSLLRETNLISELQLHTGHTGERFNGYAERKQHLLPSQQKQPSKMGKKNKNNPVKQHAVRQQIMKQWIIDFLRNCYFILIL